MNDNPATPPGKSAQPPPYSEPVWTYRGYSMKASEFVTAMVHFFRAEVTRSNVWRTRLDTTTNWAVIATGATLSIAFNQATSHHVVIILNTLLVTLFLYIEARRYRYYELWSYRVRLMETDFYAAMLVPPFHPSADWAETLAESLLQPRFPISMWEAIGRRLRRNYFLLFLILALSWFVVLWLYPTPAATFREVVSRGAVGPIDGWIALGAGAAFYAALLAISLWTLGMQQASGEVLPRFSPDEKPAPGSGAGAAARAWFRPHHKRQQLLAFIITGKAKADEIAKAIMNEMNRGVTSLGGTGMFTGEERGILMCALTVTEIHNLRAIAARIDPEAFVVTSNVREVFGKGFLPLEETP